MVSLPLLYWCTGGWDIKIEVKDGLVKLTRSGCRKTIPYSNDIIVKVLQMVGLSLLALMFLQNR